MQPPKKAMAELSFRSLVLAVLLTVLLAMSNAYLALKLGILTSASIPAAILSMGILRFFKGATILENNAVQTAASAGEAVAGGIVYTIPGLIIIGFWHGFDYWTNVCIAAIGGILGVLFSIPLRRILVNEPLLNFPEGRAIAEVLKSSAQRIGVADIVWGGVIGALLELLQVGFKLLASGCSHWFLVKRTLFGVGIGFSATMVGAGYLVGFDMALSIFLGAIMAWWIALPIASHAFPAVLAQYPLEKAATFLWNNEMRYLGIGAMLFSGIWTFILLLKPLQKSIRKSFRAFTGKKNHLSLLKKAENQCIAAEIGSQRFLNTDKDIPILYIAMGILLMIAIMFLFFQRLFPFERVGLETYRTSLVVGVIFYVLIIGFLFSVITAYFSGMVGVTASPGSSIVIAGILFIAWLLLSVINAIVPLPLTPVQINAAEAITIIIGSVVTGIAAIANDNTQDLKVGQLVGATPWKQQLMLLLGVLISSLVIPPVMAILFNVYGIAGVMPHEGMDMGQSLPAPTAALLAAITEAVFRHELPWNMMAWGGIIMVLIMLAIRLFKLQRVVQLSLLGIAIGMYLPLESSIPLFLGGLIAQFISKEVKKKQKSIDLLTQSKQTGTLIACGLVAGAALMDVLLAIPFSILHRPDIFQLTNKAWEPYGILFSIVSMLFLSLWIRKRVVFH